MTTPRVKRTSDGKMRFMCPGCGHNHVINVDSGRQPRWTWNGSFDKPTFNPSILETVGHYISSHEGSCWCDYNREHPDEDPDFQCSRCHSFVRDGRIQFLDDCSHALAGQTVDLPELE